MKILHITASYKPAFVYGGPIYSVAALCEGLYRGFDSAQPDIDFDSPFDSAQEHMAEPGTEVEVLTTLANGKEELPYQNGETKIIEGVKVTYFKRITKDHSHCSPALLTQLWKNAKQYDVIHIHSWWNLVSMGAVCVCLLRGVKPIVSPRGMLGDYTLSKAKALFHGLIGKQLLSRCDFHATTAMEADEILKQVFNGDDSIGVVDLMSFGEVKSEKGKEQGTKSNGQRVEKSLKGTPSPSERAGVRLFIIHNLVKLPNLLPVKTRMFDGTLHLIFLSRIHHKKGIELLLDALALVDFPFKLSIVGEGDFEYVESLKWKVESGKLKDKVNWIGAVYGDEKYQLLADHDAFILPSYNENFANVVIEAIAVGTPVLLSEHVGLQEYVKAHHFGLVFKLDELKESLEEAYRLLSEGKLSIAGDGVTDNKSLAHRYIEMYSAV